MEGTALTRLAPGALRDFRVRRIGFVFQDFALIDYLSVRDNVRHPARLNPALALTPALRARARFGMILPSPEDGARLRPGDRPHLYLRTPVRAHWNGELARPHAVRVTTFEGLTDLLSPLKAAEFHGAAGFRLRYEAARPRVQVLHIEPEAYCKPAEDVFIAQHTKIDLPAVGDDTGWDAERGRPMEIILMTGPFGRWAGQRLPWRRQTRREAPRRGGDRGGVPRRRRNGGAPSALMATQTVRADAAGVFTYTAPAPGW